MGDVFRLSKKPIRNYTIRVAHDQSAGTYTASWGDKNHATGPSMSAALRLLANWMDGQGLHGAANEVLKELVENPAAFCRFCDAPIFFARLPSGKFLAFDCEPVDASLVQNVRVAAMSKTVDTLNRPVVAWPTNPEGPVWIPHPLVCGVKGEPPQNEILQCRWKARRPKSLNHKHSMIAHLKAIRRDLTQGASDEEGSG